ncbi:hypothetical protein AB0M44_34790 [Streptosporangium subroseum]|uniref:hypothetical protein n=1 Tax=Streptosporangium subroseum TaxID=106412 RepID=UPI00343D3902
MQPPPTTGVARFPKGLQFKADDRKGRTIDLLVYEIAVIGESDNFVEVRVILDTVAPKIFEIQRHVAYAFMQQGIAEPKLDPTTNVPVQYKSWPIPGPYSSGDAPHPWDVIQGAKNNCRILSALQVLALCRPTFLMNALTFDAAAETCTIRLRRTPGPTEVAATNAPFEPFTFSTALPCKWAPGAPQLVYAGADTDTTYLPLWSCFFEKALATMWGGYGALTGAEERSLMSALGVNDVITLHFDRLDRTGEVNTAGWSKSMKDAFAAKRPMTTFIMGKQHNYGVVGVNDAGVIICDPNSRQIGDYFERWQGNHKVFNGQTTTLQQSVNFPMFLTWDQYFTNFMWVHIFQI